MKITFTIFAILLLLSGCNCFNKGTINSSFSSSSLETSKNMVINGGLDVGFLNTKNLTINGSAEIRGTQKSLVDGTLTVNGGLDASNLSVQKNTTVNGYLEAKNCFFHSDLKVNGSLTLKSSEVGQDLLITSSGDIADSTINGNLEVSNRRLRLGSNVKINGAIIFTKEPGVVIPQGHNLYIGENIVNGELKKPVPDKKAEPINIP